MKALTADLPGYLTHIQSTAPQEDGSILCQLECPDGTAEMELYSVLPGIKLMLHTFHTSACVCMEPTQGEMIEINYCMGGRAECRMRDGCCLYISDGDLFLSRTRNHSDRIQFPQGYYRGISLLIEEEEAAKMLPEPLRAIPIDLHALFCRFFAADDCFLIHAQESIASLFSMLYTVPKAARTAYFQLKVQELFIFLSGFDEKQEKRKKVYTSEQVNMVKQIQMDFSQNLSDRLTIEELAQQYCISATALKTCFRGIYGMPIAAYMKEYRMKQAAELLSQQNLSIAQIAKNVGYENQSKFAAAFKEIIGYSPLRYRQRLLGGMCKQTIQR